MQLFYAFTVSEFEEMNSDYYDANQEVAQHICLLIANKFPGWFSSTWIAGVYRKEYGEIETAKVTAILECLRDDGYLQFREIQLGRKKKGHFHGIGQLPFPAPSTTIISSES